MSAFLKACRLNGGRYFSVRPAGAALVRTYCRTTRALPLFRHGIFRVREESCGCFQSAEFSTSRYVDENTTTSKGDSISEVGGVAQSSGNSPNVPERVHSMADALDTNRFPMGELSVEQFLELEEKLNRYMAINAPLSRPGIEASLLLYRRLVEEHETNPGLLEEYEMTHWVEGNYPRSVMLLDEILGQWYNWWTENSSVAEQHNPENMLDLVDNLRSGDPPVQITDRTYTTLIRAATKAGDPEQAAIFADRLLDRMLEESIENPCIRPSTNALNAVLNAWAKSGLPEAPEKADALFHVMSTQYETGVLDSPPDNISYVALMLAWSRSGRIDAAEKVEQLLDAMKNSPWEEVVPNTPAYRLAIHSWVNSEDANSSLKVYALFVEMVRLYMASSRDEHVMIDGDFFSIVISKLAKERHCDKAEEIFQLLGELRDLTNDSRYEPTQKILRGMVIAYSRSNKTGAAEKAESTLRDLESFTRARGNDQAPVDYSQLPKRGYYADVIRALSESRTSDGAERAEGVLQSMIDHHRAGGSNILPDKYLFNMVLTSLGTSSRPDAAQRAENILRLMRDVSSEFKTSFTKPNAYSYLQVINAWSRSWEPDAPIRAEEVFYILLDQSNAGDRSMAPSILHHTALISCWATSNHLDGPSRAQGIFDAAVDLYEAGDNSFKPDRKLYTILMRAWSKVGAAPKVEALFLSMYEEYATRRQKSLAPNTMTFNIMLEAWLCSESPVAQHKATLLFNTMVQFSEDKTLDDVEPDGYTYWNMIEMMVRDQSGDSTKQAEKYLKLLKKTPILTDRRGHEKVFACYVSTVSAFGGRVDANARAQKEALIDELTDLVQSGKVPLPSRSEYVRFLQTVAWSRISGKSESALETLKTPRDKLQVTRDLL